MLSINTLSTNPTKQETCSLNKPNEKSTKIQNQETHPKIQRETSTNPIAVARAFAIAAGFNCRHLCLCGRFFLCGGLGFCLRDFWGFIWVFGYDDFWVSIWVSGYEWERWSVTKRHGWGFNFTKLEFYKLNFYATILKSSSLNSI